MYDQSIVKRMIAGEAEAFSQLYNDWSPAVYRKAYDELGDHAKSREAVRKVFLDVYRYAPQLKDSTLFEEWLWRLVDYYTGSDIDASLMQIDPDLQIVWNDIKAAIDAEQETGLMAQIEAEFTSDSDEFPKETALVLDKPDEEEAFVSASEELRAVEAEQGDLMERIERELENFDPFAIAAEERKREEEAQALEASKRSASEANAALSEEEELYGEAGLEDENDEEWNPIIFPPDEAEDFSAPGSLLKEAETSLNNRSETLANEAGEASNLALVKQHEPKQEQKLMFFPGWDPKIDQDLNQTLPTRDNPPEWLFSGELPNIEGDSAKEILSVSRAETLPWMRFDSVAQKKSGGFEKQFGDGGTALAFAPDCQAEPVVLGYAEAIEIIKPDALKQGEALEDAALESLNQGAENLQQADEHARQEDALSLVPIEIEYQTAQVEEIVPNGRLQYAQLPYEYVPYTEKDAVEYGALGEEDVRKNTIELIPYEGTGQEDPKERAEEEQKARLERSGIFVVEQNEVDADKPKKKQKFSAGAGFFVTAMLLLAAAIVYAKMSGLI